MWDCQEGSELVTFACKGLPQDLHWNYNGSLFCLSTKDKMDTVYDPRQNGTVAEWSPHNGTKCSKMTWLGDRPHVLTTGFNRSSQREWKMWDGQPGRLGSVVGHLASVLRSGHFDALFGRQGRW